MPERREQIADAAITIIARDGMRALTHRAVDRRLGLPGGSTSYYFRTRRALVESAVRRLTDRSRQEFENTAPPPLDLSSLAEDVARSLDRLLHTRRDDLVARHALTVELSGDTELHARLATCLFSRGRATALFEALGVADPDDAGADFVSVVEGLVFDRFMGARSLDGLEPGTERSVRQLARAVESYLRGATA
ncbi:MULTISPECIES: TetR family transcriptional regulator [unclassified Rhodococcus (in: high G+C Gram-positive bacteria)]|uniref:TetR/AcrR family transcriptional regulator n=1 Tax=unclassified Rhodococcus (in: high G+C Gram-positive bacteria) TaxID=192944 RepID=UPI001639B56F|nr:MULTISPECIES: TetR family transcriptional regulator [unclassified Rhodococcus (in: high G+C Gram-positive bacteria)]MBC2641786.1 TetR family transcriptional regulator [Rhodococcus sp. 3A]MBC2893469.1 TetR family transcriptional regulator [Rhodococcus sp. 4CII]